MDIRTIPPQPVMRQRRRLTLPQVGAASVEACATAGAAAEAEGRQPAGPWIFAAHGMPRDADTAFDLDFCLPVDGGDDLLPAFRCASLVYEGPLSGMFTDGYAPLLAAIAAAGLSMTGDSREVYLRWDGPDATCNRIEIQIGITATDGA